MKKFMADDEIRCVQFYIGEHKTFCLYHAANGGPVRRHAARADVPAEPIVDVTKVIDREPSNQQARQGDPT